MPYNPARCSHIKSDGEICNSPALKGHDKCYWHSHVEKQVKRTPNVFADIPVLDDKGAVQIVVMKVIRAIADKQIDYKAAQLIIWALQVANRNMFTVAMQSVHTRSAEFREQLESVLAHNRERDAQRPNKPEPSQTPQ